MLVVLRKRLVAHVDMCVVARVRGDVDVCKTLVHSCVEPAVSAAE